MRTLPRTTRAWFVLLLVILSVPVFAQEDEKKKPTDLAIWIAANYTKYEFRIPVRDGARLFTSVYVPKDASATNTYPILFTRTPYSVAPYGVGNYRETLGPSEQLARSKYIFVYQDVRGRFMSEGQFIDVRPHNPNKKTNKDIDESSDTHDTIDWLVKNIAYHNGRVGMWGISYPGFYVACGMIDAHPALKAASPQAPIADWWIGDDFHHNGTLFLPHTFNFYAVFGTPRPELTTKWGPDFEHGTADGYNFFLAKTEPLSKINELHYKNNVAFWNQVTQHPDYDAFWKARNLPQHIKGIRPAVLNVGGWYDAEDLYGALATYQAVAKNSQTAPATLVMGPWSHGQWGRDIGSHLGDIWFGSNTSEYYRQNIELPFFEHHLKGKENPKLPAAYAFETGRNQWHQLAKWPPQNTAARTLYLAPGGKLTFEPPAQAQATYDEYVSDPWKPVPFVDNTSVQMTKEYMTADQRLQGRRPDVLVYQTDPLEEEVTIAGPIKPSLWVSTSGTDSDFVVKLVDVHPDDATDPHENPREVRLSGYQQLVRGEPFRGRYRNAFDKPEAFEPNKPAKLEFVMPDAFHTFRRGHRIMIQIQSTWFPLVDINPQTFVPNIYLAKSEDFKTATQRVYHAPNMNSGVQVLVMETPRPSPQKQ